MLCPDTPPLLTARAVIDALGGYQAVADLMTAAGRPIRYSAVGNWAAHGHFPPRTYLVLTEALAARGHTARAALWKMIGEAA